VGDEVKKYKIIYADPPWEYEFSQTHTRAINDYPTMSMDDICNLKVKDISAEDSVLLMWVTFPKLEQAFPVIKAWGFNYVTNLFSWVKTNPDRSYFWGMGYYTRSNVELCLLAKKGKGVTALVHDIHSVVDHQIMKHSKKPPIIRKNIVRLFGDLPRIELFARKPDLLFDAENYEGWDVWGNEVESDIDLTDNVGETNRKEIKWKL
jgi:site-specific DNA-methyltransferase (adenine-specific)